MELPAYDRDAALACALELTAIPTAAGREWRIVQWVEAWCAGRPDLRLDRDAHGNLTIAHAEGDGAAPPLYITAHLDHPGFVVKGPAAGGVIDLEFRGGVKDPYFKDAPVVIHTADDQTVRATITEAGPADPFRACKAEVRGGDDASGIGVGDVGRWDLPDPEIKDGILYTHACDDLAALAAALCMMDALRGEPGARHVRLLLTRAEEIGFIGAIAACKAGTMPAGSRAVLLENSRSFPHDSPIGAGPIIRVGDRSTTFSPALTGAIAKVAEELTKARDVAGGPVFRSQRKLMPGGVCEAACYQAFGYESTCLCLPLGNYHNMADLDLVESEDAHALANARAGREYVGTDDYLGLIDLLLACAVGLGQVEPLTARLEKLYGERAHVLGEELRA